jgi:hypothetical protein
MKKKWTVMTDIDLKNNENYQKDILLLESLITLKMLKETPEYYDIMSQVMTDQIDTNIAMIEKQLGNEKVN